MVDLGIATRIHQFGVGLTGYDPKWGPPDRGDERPCGVQLAIGAIP